MSLGMKLPQLGMSAPKQDVQPDVTYLPVKEDAVPTYVEDQPSVRRSLARMSTHEFRQAREEAQADQSADSIAPPVRLPGIEEPQVSESGLAG